MLRPTGGFTGHEAFGELAVYDPFNPFGECIYGWHLADRFPR